MEQLQASRIRINPSFLVSEYKDSADNKADLSAPPKTTKHKIDNLAIDYDENLMEEHMSDDGFKDWRFGKEGDVRGTLISVTDITTLGGKKFPGRKFLSSKMSSSMCTQPSKNVARFIRRAVPQLRSFFMKLEDHENTQQIVIEEENQNEAEENIENISEIIGDDSLRPQTLRTNRKRCTYA